METKFTEGPWSIVKEGNRELFVITIGGHDHFCFLIGNDIPAGDYVGTGVAVILWPVEDDTPEVYRMMKANAHLIATAPELYKMLQESIGTICKSDEEIAGYRAILAKARGESTKR